uniref:Class II aldolase/adducin N-terminal domain-containing protein n=1 Tax=Bionectria ochroleuca TaxID=29856 RepID=A0A8H7TTA0_BIOOC
MATPLKQILSDLIVANHIIYSKGVVDAFGHISVRHPHDHDTFIMSANMAPALVSSEADFMHYRVSDGSPVQETSSKHFIERFIHSEIYKRYNEVNCVVHSHAEEVLPYAITDVKLRPVFHMTGFLGRETPIYDIEATYQTGELHDLLVKDIRHGATLASCFSTHDSASGSATPLPNHNVVLMRRHCFTVLGRNIKEAVFRAVFTLKNARIQTASHMLQLAAQPSNASLQEAVNGLSVQQITDSSATTQGVYDRPWDLWVVETRAQGLFKNKMLG